MKNDGGSIIEEGTCTTNSVPVNWLSSDEISNYLGLSNKEKEDLTKYLEFFYNSNQLTEKLEFPTEAKDADDHFPISIE